MAKRTARPSAGLSWIVTWPLLFVLAAIVFLCADELGRPVQDLGAPIGGADWEARLPERIQVVTAAVEALPLGLSAPVVTSTGSGSVRYTHRLYEARFDPETRIETQLALEAVRASDPGLTLAMEDASGGLDAKIGLDGLLTHTIRFREVHEESAPARLAFVVDGLGEDLRVARAFAEADAPFALGVWPFRPFSRQVAELGRFFRREIVLRVGLNSRDFEAGTGPPPLTLDAAIGSQLDVALASVPYAVAVMADLDAELRSDPPRAQPFFAELAQRELFSVASPTAPAALSAISGAAGSAAERCIAVRLEPADPDALQKQLDTLGEEAQQVGVVVALLQPSADVLEALKLRLPGWRAAGVEIVPLSSLRRAAEPSG